MLRLAAERGVGGRASGERSGDLSDQELVRRATSGDKHAWEALIARLTPVIHHRVALVLLRKRPANRRPTQQDILDFRQDVFVLLLEKDCHVLRSWAPDRGASLPTFAGLVAERLTLSALRTGKRGAWLEDPTADGNIDPQIESNAPSPETLALDKVTLHGLLDRLHETLSPERMYMFLALHRDERPINEVAAEMGTTPNAIYTWQSRLRAVLDKLIAEEAPKRAVGE